MSTAETTAKVCKKCGSEEFCRDGRCKACKKISGAAWQAANREKEKARSAARYAANKEKIKAQVAAWYAANREKIKAYRAAYYLANREKDKTDRAASYAASREKVKADRAAYYAANKEKVNARHAAWCAANPEVKRIIEHTRRARKHGNGGKLSRGLKPKLFKEQDGKCNGCRRTFDAAALALDHVVAIKNGGPNVDANIQLLCKPCNSRKRTKDNHVFMLEMRAKRRMELL